MIKCVKGNNLLCGSYLLFITGVCEAGYKGTDCDQCDTGYYGNGVTCTACGTHKTTPPGGSATTAD